jgi:hypothetical protein
MRHEDAERIAELMARYESGGDFRDNVLDVDEDVDDDYLGLVTAFVTGYVIPETEELYKQELSPAPTVSVAVAAFLQGMAIGAQFQIEVSDG